MLIRTGRSVPPVPLQACAYGPAAMVRSNGRVPSTGPNRHRPGLPGRRPAGHRAVGQALPPGREHQAQRGGSGQVHLVEAAEKARGQGRVAGEQHVAGAVGRVGEPDQDVTAGLGLHHQGVLRRQPGQRQPPVLRRRSAPARSGPRSSPGPSGRRRWPPRLGAGEPDLGAGPHGFGGQVGENVIGDDIDEGAARPGLSFRQCRHGTSLSRTGLVVPPRSRACLRR